MIEKGAASSFAYAPDLPGCVSVGDTLAEVKAEIRSAIEFHVRGMQEDGLAVPPPASRAAYVELGAKASRAARKPSARARAAG